MGYGSTHAVLLQQGLQTRFGLHHLGHQEEGSAGKAGTLLKAHRQQPLHKGLDPPQRHVCLQGLVEKVQEQVLSGGGGQTRVQELPEETRTSF